MDLEITILQGQDLTPKDRAFFGMGKLKSSDPYVKVMLVQNLPQEEFPNESSSDDHRRSSSFRSWSFRRSSLPSSPNNNDPRSVKLGRTPTIYKTLNPQWNETIFGSLRGHQAWKAHTELSNHPAYLEFHVFDEDQLSKSDPMGTVRIPLPAVRRNTDRTEWYEIPPDSAPQARGGLQIRLKTTLRRSHVLVRGNTFELSNNNSCCSSQRRNQVIQLGLSWDGLPQPIQPQPQQPTSPTSRGKTFSKQPSHDSFVSGFMKPKATRHVDLDASCVAIAHNGQVIMPDTVHYGNLTNSNQSVIHSGDEQTGVLSGDDESITLHLAKIPSHVLAMYIVLTVATPNTTLKDVQSTRVRVMDITPSSSDRSQVGEKHTLCTFTPSNHADSGDATAMFMLRISRDPNGAPKPGALSKKWLLTPIQDTHSTARHFGCLLPRIKAYSRDLVPSLEVNPTERVAILKKGGQIRLQDYCGPKLLPQRVTFGLSWDVDDGQAIDLDVSAICLDAHLNLVDTVWWKQLHSKDYNIVHLGDEREGDCLGDDELIDLYLPNMDAMGDHCPVHYIGFVINSYSGQKLNDVDRASCHLFDPETNLELATYALTDAKALEGVTALLVGCLYRAKHNNTTTTPSSGDTAREGEWCLKVISEAQQGRTVKSNVEGFREYLRGNPLQPPLISDANANDPYLFETEMPPFAPMADEREVAFGSPSSSKDSHTTTVSNSTMSASTGKGLLTTPNTRITVGDWDT